jgi:hypothetical protein
MVSVIKKAAAVLAIIADDIFMFVSYLSRCSGIVFIGRLYVIGECQRARVQIQQQPRAPRDCERVAER